MNIIREGLEYVLQHPDQVAAYGSLGIMAGGTFVLAAVETCRSFLGRGEKSFDDEPNRMQRYLDRDIRLEIP